MFQEINRGDPFPEHGDFAVMDGGSQVGALCEHPRIVGGWLASVQPKDWRASGLKKFKTRKGAASWLRRQIFAQAPTP